MNVDQLGVGRDIDGVGMDIREGEGIEGIGTGLGVQLGKTLPGRVEQADGALVPPSDGAVAAVVDGLGLGSSEPQEARTPANRAPVVTIIGMTATLRHVNLGFTPHLRRYVRFSLSSVYRTNRSEYAHRVPSFRFQASLLNTRS